MLPDSHDHSRMAIRSMNMTHLLDLMYEAVFMYSCTTGGNSYETIVSDVVADV